MTAPTGLVKLMFHKINQLNQMCIQFPIYTDTIKFDLNIPLSYVMAWKFQIEVLHFSKTT